MLRPSVITSISIRVKCRDDCMHRCGGLDWPCECQQIISKPARAWPRSKSKFINNIAIMASTHHAFTRYFDEPMPVYAFYDACEIRALDSIAAFSSADDAIIRR